MIQVCTRLWPEPGPRTKTVQDSRSPTGRMQMPVLESERRKNHIDMIDRDHGLLPIAMDCLHYQENERPSSEELCQRLAGLKETREYRKSVEQVERVQNDIAKLERQMGEMQVRETATVQQHQSEIQSKDRQIQKLNKQLEEQEQVTAEIQQTNHSLQRQVQQLQQQLSQQANTKPSQPPSPVPTRRIKLVKWRDRGKAPFRLCRGAAVVDGNVAYFIHRDSQACSFNSSTRMWRNLPQCPYYYEGSSIAVLRGLLTTIGGREDSLGIVAGNKLFSIMNDEDQKWVEHFPPMPTKRSHTATVTTKQHLIVAGGYSGSITELDTVEMMDIQTLVWSTVASLLHPYSMTSATICGDHLYMLGGCERYSDHTKSVLTCSLTKLLQSSSERPCDSVWHRITDVPVRQSTCAAVNGELVAVGGADAVGKSTAAVHKYNPTTDSWDIISNMPIARSYCLVAVLTTNEMMVVGGFTANFYSSLIDKVGTVDIV